MREYTEATKKSLGQHWLRDEASLVAMCEAAEVTKDDTILEIGPGYGSLTRCLVARAKHVVAVEVDIALATKLSQVVAAANLDTIHADILRFDFSELPKNYKVVANIPYYLSGHLLRLLGENANPPRKAALLVQKEVAERVAATPGQMSLLSASIQFYWQVSLGRVVPRRLFTPEPKVDSQILVLTRQSQSSLPTVDPVPFFRLLKAGFSSRRKTLLNSLSGGLRLTKEEVSESLARAAIDGNLRAQNLSLQDWQRLYQAFAQQ